MNKCKCPIPGCSFEFSYGILGWDSHVARIENHPNYHPRVVIAEHRKRLFVREFLSFFNMAKGAVRKAHPRDVGSFRKAS